MARKDDYGLPDETLQLIAAAPELFAGGKYLQQRGNTRLPGSDLIAALRGDGTNNAGFSQYANRGDGMSASARTARRGLFAPNRLAMGRVTRDVTLPGAETIVPTRIPRIVVDPLVPVDPVVPPVDPVVPPVDPVVPPVDPVVPPVDPVVPVVPVTPTRRTSIESVTPDPVDPVVPGGGGTGGGDGGTGGGGSGGSGGLGNTGTGVVGTATTGTTGTNTAGNGDSLRDAVIAAVNGSGGSIDNSSAGLNSSSSASNVLGSTLTADQLAALTKPKVPNVTLEVSGNGLSLDDAGSKSQTFDYPEFLTPDELKAYEEWMKQSSGLPGGGAVGGGKPVDDTYGNILEM